MLLATMVPDGALLRARGGISHTLGRALPAKVSSPRTRRYFQESL